MKTMHPKYSEVGTLGYPTPVPVGLRMGGVVIPTDEDRRRFYVHSKLCRLHYGTA